LDTNYDYQGCFGFGGACSKLVRLRYSGAPLPLENGGVISYNKNLFIEKVIDSNGNIIKVYRVYGKKGKYNVSIGRNQEHFLPGTYTFTFTRAICNFGTGSSCKMGLAPDREKTVDIKKGDIIHFTYVADDPGPLNLGYQLGYTINDGSHWSVVEKDDSAERDQVRSDYEEAIKSPIDNK
jgi:hypothetical protein